MPVDTRSLFGTDGVRGTAGTYPLDDRTIVRIGAATAHALQADHPRILVGRDTRESGVMIECQLMHGVMAAGGTLVSVGVMPTPAVAFLTASHQFDAGIVVSASHNPFQDNGIKVLTSAGEKASVELEGRIERLVSDTSLDIPGATDAYVEAVDLSDAYVAHALRPLAGTKALPLQVVVDCANGATSVVAPRVLREIGCNVIAINAAPDGLNINAECGSTHLQPLKEAVIEHGFDLGIAFDGDGDRVILVDHQGSVVDGDAMLFICARDLKAAGRLVNDAVVATVMSNFGLETALREGGISLHRCAVGDRQVREEMFARGAVLGGEQSGHIIFADLLSTGDGLLTALSVMRVMFDSGQTLAALTHGFETYPQVLVNVPVLNKPVLEMLPDVKDAIRSAESKLGKDGRVLVRYSGTEPLLRVMVEGRDSAVVHQLAKSITEQVRRNLG